jgi:plastocyanin
MNRTRIAALALGAAVLALTGWTSAFDGASASVSAATHASVSATPATRGTITIRNYGFSGPGRILARGARVTIRNLDGTAHTVTSNVGHAFNIRVGAHRTVTFTAPRRVGRYGFHCSIHPFMRGSLTIR